MSEVEVLFFQGCPNWEDALRRVERVSNELGVAPEVTLVEVSDLESAVELRFLGSPTVRVDGRDVEPGADDRHDFVFACRVYRVDGAVTGVPADEWIRAALGRDSSRSSA
ncbi:MAG TPA: hypothetical protein VJP39_03305 [Gaiellaceae bacterium]|nr:hypothetical protein [Gaiellaceae bacterium]